MKPHTPADTPRTAIPDTPRHPGHPGDILDILESDSEGDSEGDSDDERALSCERDECLSSGEECDERLKGL
jgi:hypothetical protein